MNRSAITLSSRFLTAQFTALIQIVAIVLVVLLCAPLAMPQVGGGFLPFTSHQQTTFDSVELSALNVNFAIPIVQKAGRGIPFDYVLSYNSNFYVVDSNTRKWVPVPSYGWGSGSQASMGYVTYYSYGIDCQAMPTKARQIPQSQGSPNPAYPSTVYDGFEYHDPAGGVHDFPSIHFDRAECEPGSNEQRDDYTKDGSGYYMSIDYNLKATVYPRSGGVLNPPMLSPTATGTVQDRNGNYVSSSGIPTNLQFTDTLGVVALTVSGAAPTITYTYSGPSGSQQIQAHYTAQNIQTSFGCQYVGEYSATGQYLLTSLSFPDGSQYSFTYYGDGRLHTATLRTLGTITYSYSGANNGINCGDGSTLGLNRTTPDSATPWTYVRSGTNNTTTTVTDPAQNRTVITFSGGYETQRQIYDYILGLLQTTNTSYTKSYNITTQITKTTIYANNSQSQMVTTFDQFQDNLLHWQSHGLPIQIDEYDYGVNARGPLLRRTIISYASLGNYIADQPATVTVQNGVPQTVAQTTYAYDEYSPLAQSGSPHLKGVTGSRGNTTTITSLVNPGTLTKHFTYYDNGNVNVATDVNGATATYHYGACGTSFATEIDTSPVTLSRRMSWDCNGAVVTDTYGENDPADHTHYDFDALWRTIGVTDPLNNLTSISYSNPPTQIETHLNNFNNNTSTVDIFQFLDSQGRVYLTQQRQSPSSGSYDTVETDYDALGQVCRVTRPFSATLMPSQGTCGSTGGSKYTYDALGRGLTAYWSSGNGYTYSYTGNDVLSTLIPAPTGEHQKKKEFEFDGLGRLASVCEVTAMSPSGSCGQVGGQNGYLTKYGYDPLGNLASVSQNAQPNGTLQTRRFYYDGLGRMTSESNPESGTVTYAYETACGGWPASNGNMNKRTDNAGNVTCFYYDALHRLTDAAGWANNNWRGPCRRFRYDSSANGVVPPGNGWSLANSAGRLVEAETDSCFAWPPTPITDEWFSYSARGESTGLYQSTPHSGGYYPLSLQYWANGALNSLSGFAPGVLPTITYNVDGEGRPFTVAATSWQNPVSNTTYNPDGQVNTLTFGSNDSDAFLYNADTGLMTKYTFTVGATPKTVVGQPAWNSNATLGGVTITDGFNPFENQTCTFGHDDLLRVTAAHCGSVWSQDFSYDAFGNITKSGSIAWNPGYNQSTNRYTLGGTSYDANGNLLNDTFHAYTWDPNWGNVASIDGATTTLTFDALGRMVEQNDNGAYTEVVYSPAGGKLALMNGLSTLVKAFVPLPAGAQAVYTSAGLSYYRHVDWLGSSRFSSTPSRTMNSDVAYAPFGENYAGLSGGSGGLDLAFTGQNQDTATGLYDFLYREYAPTQGRWISPDPAGLAAVDPSSPQSWNRYVYVIDSPLGFTDPLGLQKEFVPACRNGTNECEAVVHDRGGQGSGVYGGAVGGTLSWVSRTSSPITGGFWNEGDARVIGSSFGGGNLINLSMWSGTGGVPGRSFGPGRPGALSATSSPQDFAIVTAAPPQPPSLKPGCASGAVWPALKAAASDFGGGPPGSDPLGDVGDTLRNKTNQRAAVAAVYVTANTLKLALPIAEIGARAIPVFGWAVLGYQIYSSGKVGWEAYKQSVDQCYERK